LIAAHAGIGNAAVFKCVDRAGAVSYQQQPCADGALAVATPSSEASLHELAQAGKLAVGMSANDVKVARGPPIRVIDNGLNGAAQLEEWLYAKQGGQGLSVMLQAGKVVSWSDPGAKAGTTRP